MSDAASARQLWRARFRLTWEAVRSSYWFIPSVMAVLAGAAAIATLELDQRLPPEWLARVRWVAGDADGARAMLSTIAGSMITVAGVTFSIIMVVLPLASSQFGPRLIRNFLRDPGTEIVLGTFIGTFVYCLLVLLAVRGGERELVPHLSVTAGVGTGLLSLAVLIYFVQHVAASIRVENVIHSASRDIHRTIAEVFPGSIGLESDAVVPAGDERARIGGSDADAYVVTAHRSGYIEHLDGTGLIQVAADHDVVFELLRRPGDYLVAGEPIGRVWRAGDRGPFLGERLRERLFIGRQRTPLHDLVAAVERLTEIAVRALSPAVNDPYTAINCIDELSAALGSLADYDLPAAYRYDAEGRMRLIAVPVTFAEVVTAAYDPLRLYGAAQPAVLASLLQGYARIGRCSDRPEVRVALRQGADA
ncbi:MAG: DUF2254 domain-containing protein, partial [Gemmatimonadota bacterium]|nr:DUF2254 domain-containing protein [Gemmatimonadota bacterium]